MNVLLYATQKEEGSARLREVIEEVVPRGVVETFRTSYRLIRRLCQPCDDLIIALLAPANKLKLVEILSFRALLQGAQVILVLPDKDEDTVSKAQDLNARLVTFADSDLGDITIELRAIIENHHSQKLIHLR